MELDVIRQLDLISHCELLPDKSVDLICTDLPFGTTQNKWDSIIPFEPMWEQFKRIIKPKSAIVLFANQPFTTKLIASNYDMFRYEWIVKKHSGTGFLNANRRPLNQHDTIIIFSEGSPYYKPVMIGNEKRITRNASQPTSNYGNFNRDRFKREITGKYPTTVLETTVAYSGHLHPTQKPVALFEYLIKTYTKPDAVVFDPCAGSGTTAIAAMRSGRHYIVGDTDTDYCEIMRKRVNEWNPAEDTLLSNGDKQLSLFSEET